MNKGASDTVVVRLAHNVFVYQMEETRASCTVSSLRDLRENVEEGADKKKCGNEVATSEYYRRLGRARLG